MFVLKFCNGVHFINEKKKIEKWAIDKLNYRVLSSSRALIFFERERE